MILYTTLHRLIGLNWDTITGNSVFGIKVMMVSLIDYKRWPEWKKLEIAAVRSPFMMF